MDTNGSEFFSVEKLELEACAVSGGVCCGVGWCCADDFLLLIDRSIMGLFAVWWASFEGSGCGWVVMGVCGVVEECFLLRAMILLMRALGMGVK